MIKIKNNTQIKQIASLVVLFGVGLFCFIFSAATLPDRVAAESIPYTCSKDGSFVASSSGPAKITAADKESVRQSRAWIKSMTKTRSVVVTDSTITPDEHYDYEHQGATRGVFVLSGRTYPVNDPNVIEVTSPAIIQDEYRGVVTGRILTQPKPWRWIIQAYKHTANGTVMVPLQTLADGETGEFTIDLSSIGMEQSGAWEFGILDAEASYAPHGPNWPAVGTYDGLEVQELIATDTVYLWSKKPARADGSFSFENVNRGEKLFRLVDSASGDIVAEYYNPTGLVRSYQYSPSDPGHGTGLEDQSFVYDQAIAVFASLSGDDSALTKLLTDGLMKMQTNSGQHDGGFVFAAPQLSPRDRTAFYRTGAHAIAADALLAYIERHPSDPDAPRYKDAALRAMMFLQKTRSTTGMTKGLYTGGFGNYSGNPQVFDESYNIPWASTEHNIDIWHTFIRAARVFDESQYHFSAAAQELSDVMQETLYDTSTGRLVQGMQPDGIDKADPLDVNTWGAIYMYGSGSVERAKGAFAQLDPFTFTRSGVTGYAPFYDSGGYPGAVQNVWYEGSYGVALTAYRLGDYTLYRQVIDNLSRGQNSDGSFNYATDSDPIYEIGTAKSVAGTAWHIIALEGRDDMWNSCIYTPSTEEGGGEQVPVEPSKPKPGTSAPNSGSSVSHTGNQSSTLPEIEDDDTDDQGSVEESRPGEGGQTNKPDESDPENKDAREGLPVLALILTGIGGISVATWFGIAAYRRRKES